MTMVLIALGTWYETKGETRSTLPVEGYVASVSGETTKTAYEGNRVCVLCLAPPNLCADCRTLEGTEALRGIEQQYYGAKS